jgi:hypothetical protein
VHSPTHLSSNFRSLPGQSLTEEWTAEPAPEHQPRYRSDQPIVDALYNLAMEEARKNIEDDGTLRTGALWDGVWTRDVSYSLILSLALLYPGEGKTSLRRKVKQGRIVQDTGSGGAWPVSSDRTVWILAAWEIYLVTGEEEWLREVYPIAEKTLNEDFWTLRDPKTGMYRGESSFLDWREQTYPEWMTNADIFTSQCLGTNVVHYAAHRTAHRMAERLGLPDHPFQDRAQSIKKGINRYLWNEQGGYYGQYLYGRNEMIRSDRFEALGEALAVLFDVADGAQSRRIVAESPLTPFGVSCIFPQIPDIPAYHNNGIWPFVQAFWNLAAARVGNGAVLEHGLASLYRPAALFLSHYENMVAETGGYVGTEVNSPRMLWSIAGNLAMMLRVFLGIQPEPNGLRFRPVIPERYAGRKELRGLRYRNMVLDIEVDGFGNRIASVSLNGEVLDEAFVPGELSGPHRLTISLRNEPLPERRANLTDVHFSLPTPTVSISDTGIKWAPCAGAVKYRIYRNGEAIGNTEKSVFQLGGHGPGSYWVEAIDERGYASFASEPIVIARERIVARILSVVSGVIRATESGAVRITQEEPTSLTLAMTVERPATYWLSFRYANGNGPIHTGTAGAIRSGYVNGEYVGSFVFPQRGEGDWSDWGWSNQIAVQLEAGTSELRLELEEWNANMHGELNEALLKDIRLLSFRTV